MTSEDKKVEKILRTNRRGEGYDYSPNSDPKYRTPIDMDVNASIGDDGQWEENRYLSSLQEETKINEYNERVGGRNYNDEFVVELWNKYHFNNTKKFELLYYDRK